MSALPEVLSPSTTPYVTADIKIDQNGQVAMSKQPGINNTSVCITANKDCLLHFTNTAVFDKEFLLVKAGEPIVEKVLSGSPGTEIDVVAILPCGKPKPIFP
jgi:hypothetical protein